MMEVWNKKYTIRHKRDTISHNSVKYAYAHQGALAAKTGNYWS